MASPITVKCWGCGKSFKVKAEFAGKKGKCPVCGKIVGIPDPSQKQEPAFDINEDVQEDARNEVARSLAYGPAGKPEEKKKGILARIFGK